MRADLGCGDTSHRSGWVVIRRRQTDRGRPSKGSRVLCLVDGCGRSWRTTAGYLDQLPDRADLR
jgi:hypothetical protein